MAAEQIVGEGADIARGEDVRVLGAELRVDDDAVVDGEAGRRGELGPRDDADRDQHGIAGDLAAVVEADAGDTVRAEDRDHLAAEPDIDAGRGVAGAHPLLDRGGHGAGHQPRAGLDHRHLGAEAHRVRRDLEADEAAADDDEPLALAEPGAERLGIGRCRASPTRRAGRRREWRGGAARPRWRCRSRS